MTSLLREITQYLDRSRLWMAMALPRIRLAMASLCSSRTGRVKESRIIWTTLVQPKTSWTTFFRSFLGHLMGPSRTVMRRRSYGTLSHYPAWQLMLISWLETRSDFIYMVPPFLAYYGVLTSNRTLVEEAYTQIKLYRDILRDTSAGGLWKHVVLGSSGQDPGHWATGHGWAAQGMLRVANTIRNSRFNHVFRSEQRDLAHWAQEIHTAVYPYQRPDALFMNWVDQPDSFVDGASAALLAASVYRYSLFTEDYGYKHLTNAEATRRVLVNNTNLDEDGWLFPVVNPRSWGSPGEHSPEGQAFVLMLHTAYEDWRVAYRGHRRAD
jgi:hypothetical protein